MIENLRRREFVDLVDTASKLEIKVEKGKKVKEYDVKDDNVANNFQLEGTCMNKSKNNSDLDSNGLWK